MKFKFNTLVKAKYSTEESKVLYHGTTSKKAEQIKREGFDAGSYFTPNLDDASEYAAMGGEWDLQEREEEWEKTHGYPPREEYGSDLWDMYKDLYPKNQHPVVIEINLPLSIYKQGKPDSGAEKGITFTQKIHQTFIKKIHEVDF